MGDIRISVVTVKNGHQRPYADRLYEYRITASGLNEDQVLQFCQKFVKPSIHRIDERPNALDPYFSFYKSPDQETYTYRVTEPFAD